jgi:DNA-binding NtrC family response regulator
LKDVRGTLLVVDDDSAPLRELAARFAAERYRVATCPRWDVALEFVAQNAPDFVLTDARTFYLEGPPLLARIRAASPRTRVIFLDNEGAWSVFLEPQGGDGAVTLINPCRIDELMKGAIQAVEATPPKQRSAEETWV